MRDPVKWAGILYALALSLLLAVYGWVQLS
jgi:hypothetical protein